MISNKLYFYEKKNGLLIFIKIFFILVVAIEENILKTHKSRGLIY